MGQIKKIMSTEKNIEIALHSSENYVHKIHSELLDAKRKFHELYNRMYSQNEQATDALDNAQEDEKQTTDEPLYEDASL